MSHNVYVDDTLEFKAESATKANIKGNLCTERMSSVDNFDQSTLDTTNDYTVTVGGTSDAVALTAGGESGVKFTTGTGDNEVCYMGTALIFDITQKPVIESRIKIVDVSGTIVFFGFSDANTETTPASTIDGDTATLAAAATDAVGFVIDADLGTSSIYCASINAGGTIQSVDTGLDWADNQSKNLRVELDASGNAKFFVDGLQEGYIALAVADVPLCAIYNAGTRANDGANLVYARYLKKWQDIP